MVAIGCYIVTDWLRNRAAGLLAARDIMPVWNMKGIEKYNVLYATKRTAYARRKE
jgi:hypothetical protein